MPTKNDAKKALDNVIAKSRVHLYKPIQIAEILYHIRTYGNIDPLDLEDYRTKSKHWRDDICRPLLGRVCTSSAKFQDNLFDGNAVPPIILILISVLIVDKIEQSLQSKQSYTLNTNIGLKSHFIHFLNRY